MISIETLSFFIMICVLAPLVGAFTILFLLIFEKRFEALESQANKLALEKELQQSKYDILSQKIQPHFFFNTLNVILGLARLDRKTELIRSIETLAKFMKRNYKVDNSLATVDEELTYTSYYLDIQTLRMGERLTIKKQIDQDLLQILIPSYVIQTLTENCFKHSFEKLEGPAILEISLHRSLDGKAELCVWNSKHIKPEIEQLSSGEELKKGIGLENIRERLALLYPEGGAELTLEDSRDGTAVTMKWPIHSNPKKG
ncbi:histidine kinase [Virgibacillus halodenitrificans]|uniref:sensor histidine kinase n=1 Tax=Virgibacillus halodenitrificans TaxID=1482 RepID=UPI0024C0E1B9|nr:histidine kinase [Virgibacillus halodenitrificans]WHX25638.1 histidine kinase [Virgibacillus halodenitrificans]